MNNIKLMNDIGLDKIKMAKVDPILFFTKSIMAGFYLGMALILSYTLGALFHLNFAVSKTLIAITFGSGLVLISFLGAELFTGNCLTTIIPVFDKKAKIRDLIPAWSICYIGNAIGISLIGILFSYSQSNLQVVPEYFHSVFESKAVFEIFPLLTKAILCNFLVCMAAYAAIKLKKETSLIFIIIVCVSAFVIAGLEHSIANWGVYSYVFAQSGFQLDWSTFPLHMFISTLGNAIGGSLLLGYPLYISIRNDK